MKPPRNAFFGLPTLALMTLLAADLVGCSGHGGSGTSSLAITASSPPTGTTGMAYADYTFTASGGTPPLNWSESGSLPPGLMLRASGVLSGTPSTAGTYPISLTVTDSSMPPLMASAQVSLKINESALVVANAAPPTGTVGNPYPGFTFTATGGSPPYTWRSSGTLPPGLKVGSDGAVSGTPTQGGSFSFSVTATDSAQPPMTSTPLATQITINGLTINNGESPTGTVGVVYAPFEFSTSNGVLPLAWSETPLLTMGLTLNQGGVLSGTPTTAGQFPITLQVTDATNRAASVQTTVRVSIARPPAAFNPTGSLVIPRSGHTATLLLSGDVLVTGGGNGGPDATAEVYSAGGFTRTNGNMIEARSGHTATLLSDSMLPNYGKVLIVGSADTTAELYDPASGTFTATGSMHHARTWPTATLLNTGKVLIVGGNTTTGDRAAELYDPSSGTFSDTGSTTLLRTAHTATPLIDGHVLITGGTGAAGPTAELYDPATGTFTPTAGNMTEPRSGQTATLLGAGDGSQNGSVLIIGTDGSADLYNPNTETFASVGSLLFVGSSKGGYTASLRNDGTVLVAGGYFTSPCNSSSSSPVSLTTASLFAPESDGFTVTGSLSTARDTHTATVLSDGSVLVIGGTLHSVSYPTPNSCQATNAVLASAELFKTEVQHTYTLTGYCYGYVSNTYNMCAIARDTAQCPMGQPAVTPSSRSFCHGGSASVDASTTCRVRTNNGQTISGACLIR